MNLPSFVYVVADRPPPMTRYQARGDGIFVRIMPVLRKNVWLEKSRRSTVGEIGFYKVIAKLFRIARAFYNFIVLPIVSEVYGKFAPSWWLPPKDSHHFFV